MLINHAVGKENNVECFAVSSRENIYFPNIILLHIPKKKKKEKVPVRFKPKFISNYIKCKPYQSSNKKAKIVKTDSNKS